MSYVPQFPNCKMEITITYNICWFWGWNDVRCDKSPASCLGHNKCSTNTSSLLFLLSPFSFYPGRLEWLAEIKQFKTILKADEKYKWTYLLKVGSFDKLLFVLITGRHCKGYWDSSCPQRNILGHILGTYNAHENNLNASIMEVIMGLTKWKEWSINAGGISRKESNTGMNGRGNLQKSHSWHWTLDNE